MAGDLGREGVVAQRVADGARRGRELLRHGGVRGVLPARHLAEECEHSLLERRLVGEGDFGEVRGEVLGLMVGKGSRFAFN